MNFDNPTKTKRLTKIEKFNNKLEKFLEEKRITTNIEIYYFTYCNGYISEQASDCLRELKRIKKLSYSGHTKISWDKVKQNDIVKFTWIG